MASLMENLIDVLQRLDTEYENLLALSMQKTTAIVKADLVQLSEITDDEQRIVSKVNALEKEHTETMQDIANVINKDVENLKLTNLIQLLEQRPEEQQQLAQVHDQLKSVAQRMKLVNEQNRELLQSSLEMVEFDMNLIQAAKTAPETANYNRGAYNTGSIIGTNAGNFDAKQ